MTFAVPFLSVHTSHWTYIFFSLAVWFCFVFPLKKRGDWGGGGLLGSSGALGGSSLVHVLVTPVVPANGKGLFACFHLSCFLNTWLMKCQNNNNELFHMSEHGNYSPLE